MKLIIEPHPKALREVSVPSKLNTKYASYDVSMYEIRNVGDWAYFDPNVIKHLLVLEPIDDDSGLSSVTKMLGIATEDDFISVVSWSEEE